MQRYRIKTAAIVRPLLWLFAAFPANSYLALSQESLRLRFGVFFDSELALTDIDSVIESKWPFLFGLGWRTDFRGRIGLIGSYSGIVEVRLKRPQRFKFILPFWRLRCDRLVVSLEDPQGFLSAFAGYRGA